MDHIREVVCETLGLTSAHIDAILGDLDSCGLLAGRTDSDILIDVWLAVMGGAGVGDAVQISDELFNLPALSNSDTLDGEEVAEFGALLVDHIVGPHSALEQFVVSLCDGVWTAAAHYRDGVLVFSGPAAGAPALVDHVKTCAGGLLPALVDIGEAAPVFDAAHFVMGTSNVH